mmetsp:Transcript_72656/g.210341  ORF Transcript_72656/g.210341 Transcript_72656/m.210341 type:complete len:613 (-) Transcript_72656:392-2230(-)
MALDIGDIRESWSPTAPVAELLRCLQAADAQDREALCNALAERVQHVAPSDVPQLVEALLAALHRHLGAGLRDAASLAVFDELCGSWKRARHVPQDALRTLLRLMLQGERPQGQRQLRSAKSSPDLLRRAQSPSACRLGALYATAADPDLSPRLLADDAGLPKGDARALQVLLRLVGSRGDSLVSGARSPSGSRGEAVCEVQGRARTKSRRRGRSVGSSCCSVEHSALHRRDFYQALASPAVTSGTAAPSMADFSEEMSWVSRIPSPERGTAQHCVFDMAEDDSSAGSRASSRTAASLDWCFDALNTAPASQSGERRAEGVRSLALTSRSQSARRRRGQSVPAQLGPAGDMAIDLARDLGRHDLRRLGGRAEADGLMSQQFGQLRHNQIVCLQAAQETAALVVEMNRAVEAERAARLAEIQERTALRAELRTVCAQVEALAQGQQELQQCMMMMCARMAQQGEMMQQQQQQQQQLRPSADAQQPLPQIGYQNFAETAAAASKDRAAIPAECPTPSGRRTVNVHGKGMQQRGETSHSPQRPEGKSAEALPPGRRAINLHKSRAGCERVPGVAGHRGAGPEANVAAPSYGARIQRRDQPVAAAPPTKTAPRAFF